MRISHSRPPCVIPIPLGAGTRRKYPPAGVMAKQPTMGCFWDGRDRSAPYLAVFDVEQLHTGGHGAPSSVAWRLCTAAGNVFRIGYSVFKVRSEQTAGAKLGQDAFHDLLICSCKGRKQSSKEFRLLIGQIFSFQLKPIFNIDSAMLSPDSFDRV